MMKYVHRNRVYSYFAGGTLVFAVLAGVFSACLAEESQAERPGGNSKCYVCHPAMKTEELTTNHLGITCDVCHGASTEHMHDEMLMTKPDLLFGRAEVRGMCSKCHEPGGERQVYGRQDHAYPDAVEAFFKKWTGRMRPNGRAVTRDSVCTDCHGTHNISEPLRTQSEGGQPQWVAAFNGRDLTGWQSTAEGSWTVKAGRIIGKPGGNEKGSTLWTEATYDDYLLAMTFKATWPIHAGIWLRSEGSKHSPRIEIIKAKAAFTSSVLVPGKGLALTNLREDLVDYESWNTISVKVEADRIQVWLNGEEIGVVRVAGPAKGKIGLYIDPASKSAELTVREVLVQRLVKPE
ncbi:MAG: hypothetical protein CEE38_03170 [Planctomycetes bacterium B3_Pla]|nr:MAG: hypothetical protein CEE38_03170 [Planctomycetes bacterium B3_Pla]